MPSGQTYEPINCRCCGKLFTPSQDGHAFCRHKCRWTGAKPPEEWEEWDAVERLWDELRDPDERVRPDDWLFKSPSWLTSENSVAWRHLHDHETVGLRRRQYRRLEAAGEL